MGIDLGIRILVNLFNFGHDLFLSCFRINAYSLLLSSVLDTEINRVGRKLIHGAFLLIGCSCIFNIFLEDLVAIALLDNLLFFLIA